VVVNIAEVQHFRLGKKIDVVANNPVQDVAHRNDGPSKLLSLLLLPENLGKHVFWNRLVHL
jgi:hypothetical protein